MKTILISLLFFLAQNSFAATYTVKTSGGDYSSPGTCANAVSAGDICEVYNGSYSGWTQSQSGSGGNYIIVKAASGQTPSLTSGITLSGRSYIHIEGFGISGGVSCSGSGSYIKIINNTLNSTVSMTANYVLVSGNTFNNMGNDAVRQFGTYWVVSNNTMVTETDSSDVHMDFWQSWCESGRLTAAQYLVLENNTFVDISGGNVHFTLINDTNNCTVGNPTNHIYRYNKVHNIGSMGVYIDNNNASSSGSTRNVIYNNTISKLNRGSPVSWKTMAHDLGVSSYSSGINNIYYDSMYPTGAIGVYAATGWSQGYNLYYDPDNTMTFSSPASSETGAVKNQNPLLVNPDSLNFAIASNSPARDAGGHLTTASGSGSNSTALTVAKSEFFSWGWGVADADWIAVGTVSNVSQISTINYGTNVITLASPLTWSNGASVWLYKRSDGTRVLYGTAPDIGAVEYNVDGGDETNPVVTISTSDPQTITSDSLSVAWTCSDAVGVTSQKWRIGAAPSASYGTTATSPATTSGYSQGSNTLYVGCGDAAGNLGSDSITVTYDSVPAFIDNLSPSGVLPCTSNPRNVVLSHTTDEAATSRMTTVSSAVAYADMTDTFTTTGSTSHSETKSLACGESYNYWVRTSDASGNVNTSSEVISFSIASPQIAGPGGLRLVGGKIGH